MSDGPSEEFKRKARENAHPVRCEILQIFAATTTALSVREVAKMLHRPVSQVRYHVNVLEAISELRLDREEPRKQPHGVTVERFYACG